MSKLAERTRVRNHKIMRLRGTIPTIRYNIPDDVVRDMDNLDYVALMNGLTALEDSLDNVKGRKMKC